MDRRTRKQIIAQSTHSDHMLRLRDPLSEITRKERLYLLGISTVGITIEYTGLIPSEITTLGIKFGQANQNALLYILALVIAYYLAAFVIYAASDYFTWRLDNRDLQKEMREEQGEEKPENLKTWEREVMKRYRLTARLALFVPRIRWVFEMLLPIAVCLFAIFVLVF